MKKTQTKKADQNIQAIVPALGSGKIKKLLEEASPELREWMLANKADAEAEAIAWQGIAPVYCYEMNSQFGRVGFGYRESDGKLIHFKTDKDISTGAWELDDCEMSLAESLEWVEKFEYVESVLAECMQKGGAYERWIRDLRMAIQNQGAI